MNAPDIWFVVSGIFFALASIGAIVTIFLLFRIYQMLLSIQPTLERTAMRIEEASNKIESVAKTAETTVQSIGGSARNVAGSLESVVVTGARRFESIAGVLMMAMAGIRLYKQFAGLRAARSEEEDEDES